MKKGLVLVLGLFFIAAGLLFAREAKAPSAAFALASSGGGGAPGSGSLAMSFSLVGTAAAPTGGAGPGGAGVIEDPDYPYNTAIGWQALCWNTPTSPNSLDGTGNTAVGYQALYANNIGRHNTAIGYRALINSTTGVSNTAVGVEALFANREGTGNSAYGVLALNANTSGFGNTAIGLYTLVDNSTGSYNTAIGMGALQFANSGYTTALGYRAGFAATGGKWNVFLGANSGQAGDTNTIRIGTPYDSTNNPPSGQNQTFIAGIAETALDASMTPAVVGITGEGRLGKFPAELLPQGPPGPPGIRGPAGEGLVRGFLLFLRTTVPAPAGYTLLGTCHFSLMASGSKKPTKLTVNVYEKQ